MCIHLLCSVLYVFLLNFFFSVCFFFIFDSSFVSLQVSDKTEIGLQTTYNVQSGNPSLGIAGKYNLDDGGVLRVSEYF